jgi:hypothetical protein
LKTLFIILIILFSINICNSQKKAKTENISGKALLKVLKIITIGNEDYYYSGRLVLTYLLDIPNDSIILTNSDTLIKLFDEKDLNKYLSIKIKVRSNVNDYAIKDFTEVLSKNDTVLYVLNYDTLGYKEQETERKQIETENQETLTAAFNQLLSDARESVSYYTNKIEGKSYSKIADILYDEGFSRSFSSSGSVLKEIFSITYTYGDIPYTDKSYTINIALWHSYGYGKSFYSIDYSIYLLGKWYSL